MLRSQAAGLTAERRQPEDGVGEGGAEEPDLERGAVADGAQEGHDASALSLGDGGGKGKGRE